MRKKGTLREPLMVIGPSIAYIVLTKGQFATVDADNAAFLSQWNWNAKWYTATSSYYARRHTSVGGKEMTIPMHDEVFPTETGSADHINRSTLDNRQANLRSASRFEQMRNQGLRRDRSSGFRGVSMHIGIGRWQAQICIKGQKKHLGYFATKEETARAYDKAAKQFHGEFA